MLGVLKILVADRVAVLVDAVEAEVRVGAHRHPALTAILEADWLQKQTLSSLPELRWFTTIADRLVGADQRNIGEAAVLAWAKANGDAMAVLDDTEARKAADEFGVPKIGTLGLLVDSVNNGHLGRDMASQIADEWAASGARSPFRPGHFIGWADASDASRLTWGSAEAHRPPRLKPLRASGAVRPLEVLVNCGYLARPECVSGLTGRRRTEPAILDRQLVEARAGVVGVDVDDDRGDRVDFGEGLVDGLAKQFPY